MHPLLRQRYTAVLERIRAHLAAPQEARLDIDTLADVACLSRFHFQRQFAAVFGCSAAAWIQQQKLHRAAWMLAYRTEMPLGEIAALAGYENAESFSRVFRQHAGATPSAFRTQPDGTHPLLKKMSLQSAGANAMTSSSYALQIREFDAVPLLAMRHQGDPARLMRTVQAFIGWRKQSGLSPRISATWNILWEDIDSVAPEDYRFDVAATRIEHALKPEALPHPGVFESELPAGRVAVLHLTGSDAGLRDAFAFLYGEWLPASGETPRDFPPWLQRVVFFPDVPAHQAITDIYLPLV